MKAQLPEGGSNPRLQGELVPCSRSTWRGWLHLSLGIKRCPGTVPHSPTLGWLAWPTQGPQPTAGMEGQGLAWGRQPQGGLERGASPSPPGHGQPSEGLGADKDPGDVCVWMDGWMEKPGQTQMKAVELKLGW